MIYTKLNLLKFKLSGFKLFSLSIFTILNCLNFDNILADDNLLKTVVVTPNKTKQEKREIANSVTVITSEDIRRSQQTELLEILKQVPSIDVVQTGGAGGQTSVFIRGANSEHTLVLLDGIELNDPGSTARSFNFSNFTLENIDRIEILRGPQSIYGSDALGGVIAIYTKEATKNQVTAKFEAGSFNTFRESLNINGKNKNLSYNLGVQREDIHSFSAVKDPGRMRNESDSYKNTSVTASGSYKFNDNYKLNTVFRNQTASTNIDNSTGVGGDDPNRIFKNRTTFLKLQLNTNHLNNALKTQLATTYSDNKFSDNNRVDAYNQIDFLNSEFESSLLKFFWNAEYRLNPHMKFVTGVETEKEKATSFFNSDGAFGPFNSNFPQAEQRTSGIYLESLNTINEYLSFTIGGRFDRHDNFGNQENFRIAPVISFTENSRLKLVYGTGYKAPSLVQLFSSFGNPNLGAEESKSFEVAFEQELGRSSIFEVRYFKNEIENLIDFDPNTFVFGNITSGDFEGFETSIKTRIEKLLVTLNYSYTDTENNTSNRSLLRRARNKASLNLSYNVNDKLSIGNEYLFVGKRFDNDFSQFPANREKLASYLLVNLLSTYKINENIELLFRVENLLNRQYENVLGFNTPGIAGYGGIRIKL